MAFNFEKVLALTTKAANGTDSFQLADNQLAVVLSFIVDYSLIDKFGVGIQPSSISSGSVTYTKNVAGKIVADTGFGVGTITGAALGQVTIQFDTPEKIGPEGFTKADLQRGVPNASAVKLQKFINQLSLNRERQSLKALLAGATDYFVNGTDKTENDLLDNSVSPMTAYLQLVQMATDITLIKDPSQGIELIQRSWVETQVRPQLLNKIALASLVGNSADQTFAGGAYRVSTIGGYSITSNPFLVDTDIESNKVLAVSSTNFAFKSIMAVTGVISERLSGTTNHIFMVSTLRGHGFIYTGVTKKLVTA